MKCSRCHENTAIVFVTKMENGQPKREGLCLPCAQKEGLAPMDALLQQTGMSQDEFNNISEQMTDMFQDMDMDQINEQLAGGGFNAATGAGDLSELFNSAFVQKAFSHCEQMWGFFPVWLNIWT